CAGLTAGNALVAQCAKAFNMTTAQVLAIEKNPAAQYYGLTGGNPNLNPETSDTVTIGFVAQPSFLPGSNFSLDWFDIKVEDYISGIGADTIIKNCVNNLDAYFCGLVKRDSNGSIWLSQNGYVVDTTLNTGSLQTRGIDVAANYRFNLDDLGLEGMGSVTTQFTGTWLDQLVTQSLPGGPKVDCAGVFGSICLGLGGSTTPNPEWRHKFRVEWATPFPADLKLSAQWRYFSKVDHEDPAAAPKTETKLDARSYLDLLATFNVMDNYSFRLGVNNVLDKDPPLTGQSNCPSGSCNGNTFPQMYDSLGRYFFVGVTADF
ncbi:MAG TPA: TonB-dependent receptor, partial [Phenylobacterium sp.]|nr:TonB-dependent receptor [Phenylobacterium sp.]